MNIHLVGTGSIWPTELSSCAIVDDAIMLDCPNGMIKALKRKSFIFENLCICLITHFHADHFFDIPFLLIELALHAPMKRKLTFIGPKGIREKIEQLFMLAYPDYWERISHNLKICFVECDDKRTQIKCEGYEIVPYKMSHNDFICYGYTIQKGYKRVGFTGDTLFCENVERIIQSSQISFVDMTFCTNSLAHMGVNDMLELKKKYGGEHILVPTHMGREARIEYDSIFHDAPADGTLYII